MLEAKMKYIGEQLYEKMISGMYLGEMVRRLIFQLIERNVLFAERNWDKQADDIFSKARFFPQMVSNIETYKYLLFQGEISISFLFSLLLIQLLSLIYLLL